MTVSRVSLPAEFYDKTSAMMLRQPEPEYLFAKLAAAAQVRAELLATDAAAVLNATGRGPDTQGAPSGDLAANQLALGSYPLAEAVVAVPEVAQKGVGHTIRINRPVFSGGGYTEKDRTVGANQSISQTPIDISEEQVSITVKRYVGPFASGGSQPQPYAIDRLDARKSVHQLAGLVGLNLSRDHMKWRDAVIMGLFDQPGVVVRPQQLTADSSFPGAGTIPLDLLTLFAAEQKLRSTNIPAFADGTYLAVVNTQQMLDLKTDPDFLRQAVFDRSQNPLGIPSIVRVGRLSVVESNTLTVDTTTVSGASINHGLMFGPGAVGFGLDDPPRVANAMEDNFGETQKVIWIEYSGFTMLDNRFVVGMRSS